MTITKHTPVVPSETAQIELNRHLETGVIDLRRPNPPRWLDAWLDLQTYRSSTPAERRTLAAEGLERQRMQKTADRAPSRPQSDPETVDPSALERTPDRLPHAGARARPGTRYVPCAGGCGSLMRRGRACLSYCNACPRPERARKRKPKSTDLEELQ